MYMPGALKHLYEVAEITNADVVHMPNRLRSGRDGVVNADTKLYMQSWGGEKIDKVTVMPKDPLFRLQMWVNKSITGDAPFNLFKRQFLVENNFVNIFHSQAFLLLWLMKADVFVETPLPLYIYRDSPDSTTRNNNLFPIERVLYPKMNGLHDLSEALSTIEIFKDNECLKTFVEMKWLSLYHQSQVKSRGVYDNGITPELHQRVYDFFKKYFGDNALYPTLLFHWIHIIPTPYSIDNILLANLMPLIDNKKK